MRKMLLAFLLFLAIWNTSIGQRTLLMLQKKNRNKNAYYKQGDEISFRKNGSKRKVTGKILDLRDSVIVFHGFEVRVNEISSLYIDEKTKWWLRYKIEQIGLIAGIGYLTLDLINNGEISRETLAISGTSICVGLIGKILIGNRIKIKGRTKLRILRFENS
jgi:hypothetical protein